MGNQIGKLASLLAVTVTPQKDTNIRLPVGGPCFVWGSFSPFLVLPLFVLVGSVGIVSCTSCLPPPSTSPCAESWANYSSTRCLLRQVRLRRLRLLRERHRGVRGSLIRGQKTLLIRHSLPRHRLAISLMRFPLVPVFDLSPVPEPYSPTCALPAAYCPVPAAGPYAAPRVRL